MHTSVDARHASSVEAVYRSRNEGLLRQADVEKQCSTSYRRRTAMGSFVTPASRRFDRPSAIHLAGMNTPTVASGLLSTRSIRVMHRPYRGSLPIMKLKPTTSDRYASNCNRELCHTDIEKVWQTLNDSSNRDGYYNLCNASSYRRETRIDHRGSLPIQKWRPTTPGRRVPNCNGELCHTNIKKVRQTLIDSSGRDEYSNRCNAASYRRDSMRLMHSP